MPLNEDDGATRYWLRANELIAAGAVTRALAQQIALNAKPGGRPRYWASKLQKLEHAATGLQPLKRIPWEKLAEPYGITSLTAWTVFLHVREGRTKPSLIRRYVTDWPALMAAICELEDLGLVVVTRTKKTVKEVQLVQPHT